MIDLTSLVAREEIISETKIEENKSRKALSIEQYDIYSDRLDSYVQTYLRSQFSSSTVAAMPVVSSINLTRRIINQEASIYACAPDRSFQGVDDSTKEVLEAVYADGKFDVKFNKSNIFYKLQNQNLLQVVLKNGKLSLRSLMGHHYDVVPKLDDPEVADCYLISAFDKSLFLNSKTSNTPATLSLPTQPLGTTDGINQNIGDADDYLSVTDKYVVWSDQFNFVMDGKGKVISGPDVENPLAPIMPFVDVSADKDFEYFVRQGQTVVDFTIQYNAALSDLGNVVRLQGWAQAFLKATADQSVQNLVVGPNRILHLVVDPNSSFSPEFGFVSPNADLQGSIAYTELLLANFLSSRGIDPKTVSGTTQSTSYSSGLERLLAMIEKFEASRNDLALYQYVESRVFDIVKAYLNKYSGTEFLNQKYWVKQIPQDASITVQFEKPEAIQSEGDMIVIAQKKIELGLLSRVGAIMELEGLNRDSAEEYIAQVDEDMAVDMPAPAVDNTQNAQNILPNTQNQPPQNVIMPGYNG